MFRYIFDKIVIKLDLSISSAFLCWSLGDQQQVDVMKAKHY